VKYNQKKLLKIIILMLMIFTLLVPLASATPRGVDFWGYAYLNEEAIGDEIPITVELSETGEELPVEIIRYGAGSPGGYSFSLMLDDPETSGIKEGPVPGDEIVFKIKGIFCCEVQVPVEFSNNKLDIFANPPILNPIGPQSVDEGSELLIDLSATDADGDALTFATDAAFGELAGNLFSWTPTFDDSGVYTVEFSVSDGKNGLASEKVEITVKDVNRAPVLSEIGAQSVDEGSELLIELSATDADGDDITFATDAAFGELAGNVFSWTPTYDDAGDYSVNFTVDDGKGGLDFEVVQIEVKDVNRPPVLSEIGAQSVDESSELLIELSATDADGDALIFATDAAFGELIGNVFSWTPTYDDSGVYTVEFSVSDGRGGFASELVGITVIDVNRAPELGSIGQKSVDEGSELVITLTATDSDGDALTFATDATFGELVGNVFSWTPTYDDSGVYYVEFSISDGKNGLASELVEITVNDINRAPELASIGPKSVSEGTELIVTLSASDADGDSLIFATDAAFGELVGNVFRWTPTFDDSGDYSVNFTVDDGKGGLDFELVQITVNDVNRDPELASIGAQSVNEGSELLIELSATDVDGDTLTFAADAAFGGLAGNMFSWTPVYDDSGVYTVEFSVSDGKGGFDSELVEITVIDVNRAPELGSIGQKSVDEGSELVITLTATDADGDALTFATDAAFGDLVDNVFIWTPDYGESGIYNVEFTVSDSNLSDSETVHIAVGDVNRPPELAPIGAQSVDEGSVLVIELCATDEDGDTLTFAKNEGSVGTLSDNIFSLSPGYDAEGTYSVEFSVSDDNGGLDSELVGITVKNINQAPLLPEIGAQFVDEGSVLVIELCATDEDGDTLTYSKDEGSVGTLADNVFTWTPGYDEAGTYSVEFSVSDGNAGLDSEIVPITVGDVNRAPVLAEIGPKATDENTELVIELSATDEDGDTLTYSKDEGSVGTLTDNVFSWTPTYDDSGVYTVEFSVSDGSLSDT